MGARSRAKRAGIPFTIKVTDIHVPVFCPILGLPLERGKDSVLENSPSLDRLKATDGYVPGNISVISHRANRMKSDASLTELKAIVRWMEEQG